MEALFWGLVAMGAILILTGYFYNRLVYTSGIWHRLVGHGFAHGLRECVCHSGEYHGWRVSIQDSPFSFWSRIGTLAGLIGLLTALLIAVASVISSLAELIEVIGHILVPQ